MRVNWNESPDNFRLFWSEELKNRTDISTPDKNTYTALCAMDSYRQIATVLGDLNNYDENGILIDWFGPYSNKTNGCDITIIQLMSTFIKGVKIGKVTECIHHLADVGLIECPPHGKTKNETGSFVITPLRVRIIGNRFCSDNALSLLLEEKLMIKSKNEYRSYNTEHKEDVSCVRQESSCQDEESKRNKWIDDTRKQLIMNATKSELSVKTVFDSSNVSYVFQQPFVTLNGNIYFVDFYIPSLDIGIEVDGGYHTTKEQRIKDLERTIELEESFKIRIYRIDNSDTSYEKLLQHCLSDIIYRRKNELGKWDIIL